MKSLLLISFMLFAFESSAGIYSESPGKFVDPRKSVNRKKYPQLYSIGFIEVWGEVNEPRINAKPDEVKKFKPERIRYRGTGVLINECLVFTNHHVAFIERDAKDVKIISTTFYAGEDNQFVSSGEVVFHGHRNTDPLLSEQDWAIIRLDKSVFDPKNPSHPRFDWKIPPVFIKLQDAAVAYRPEVEKAYLTAAYYHDLPESRDGKQLFAHLYCSIWDAPYKDGLWRTNCAARPGVSGAPVFSQSGEEKGVFQSYGLLVMGAAQKDGGWFFPPFNPKKDSGNGLLAFSRMVDEDLQFLTEKRLAEIIKSNACAPAL